jgi:hypothetical protein
MAFFLITATAIGVWRLFHRSSDYRDTRLKNGWPATLALLFLGCFVWFGSGNGLMGDANFNYSRDKRGGVFNWIKNNTAPAAHFAGHPTHIDGLMLFAERRALATTETAHPFYPVYFNEIKRRLELSLKAHYAQDPEEILALLKPEKVDYFIFARKKFYPEMLNKEEYFEPLNSLVQRLASHPPASYAYKKLAELGEGVVVFRDDQSVIIDLAALEQALNRAPQ